MAMHAHPVPSNPYNPLVGHKETSDSLQYPSPFVPIRFPIFGPVLWLNDHIVQLLSIGGKNHQYSPIGGSQKWGRQRALSDSTVESAEEGSQSSFDQNLLRHPMARTVLSNTSNLLGNSRRKAD